MPDFEDRLIDTLLAEEVGNQQCPDLTDRILDQISPSTSSSWPMRIGIASAAAAAMALLITLASLVINPSVSKVPNSPTVQTDPPVTAYPAPVLTGKYRVLGGSTPSRGSVIQTDQTSIQMTLGGYIQTTLSPHSSVRLAGDDHQEAVYLVRGAMHCKVEKNIGKFTIQTDVGSVTVLGTEFEVHLDQTLWLSHL